MLALLTFFILVLALSVDALEVTIGDAEAIYPDEQASFPVIITNDRSATDTVELTLRADTQWSFETRPLTYLSPFTIQEGDSAVFDLLVTPISPSLLSGKYSLTIPFSSFLTGETTAYDVIVQIKNPDSLTDYVPALSFVLDAVEDVDPRKISKVKLEVRNRNPLNITEMVVDVSSSLYNETKIVPIEPLETTTIIFEIQYDPQQEPTDDILVLTVTAGETIFTPIRKEIHIIQYVDIIEYKHNPQGFFFKTTTVTEYTNKGNAETAERLIYPTSLFAQFFTSTDPDGDVIHDNGLLYYATDVTFPINETVVVTHVVNYRPLFILVLLIAAGVWLYFVFRSPVVVRKETITQHIDSNGRMKIKVLIHIKNRSMKLVDDVDVRDKIPAVAELEKHFELGTMAPSKILKHPHAGTILQWKIHHLEAYEERIITYKIQSRFSIVGNFTLPGTEVKFKGKKDEVISVVSPVAKVAAEVSYIF
jgi:hypothetical protein